MVYDSTFILYRITRFLKRKKLTKINIDVKNHIISYNTPKFNRKPHEIDLSSHFFYSKQCDDDTTSFLFQSKDNGQKYVFISDDVNQKKNIENALKSAIP